MTNNPFPIRKLSDGKPTIFCAGTTSQTCQHRHRQGHGSGYTWNCTDCGQFFDFDKGKKSWVPLTPAQARQKMEEAQGKKREPSCKDFVGKERPAEVDTLKAAYMEEGARLALEEAKSRIDTVRSEEIIGWMLYARDYGFPVPPGPSAHSGFPVPKPAFLTKCGA